MTTDATPSSSAPAGDDPISGLVRLFVTDYQVKRIKAGERPARRAVFRRFHGAAHGTFEVLKNLPHHLRVGIFAGERYPAWVRFSSDTVPEGPDLGQECGVGVKLFNVPGEKLTETGAETHDFVLQNIDRFFVDDAQQMYEFTLDPGNYLKAHPETAAILNMMSNPVGSAVCIPYWSCLPSRFGDRFVKYKLVPDTGDLGPPRAPSADYLAVDLKTRLSQSDIAFTFCIQLRTDSERMPLDRATVVWEEAVSEPVPVARLVLDRQDIDEPGNADYADNLAFSAWHALPVHEPVGSIQEARRVVYGKSAAARHWANGIADCEPTIVRPRQPPY